MATIKTVLRSYKNNEGKQKITIRVSHKGKTSYHPTGEYILAKYFSTKEGKVKSTLSGWIQINTRLDNLLDTYKQKLNELLISGHSFSVDDITIATDTAIANDEFYQYAYAYAEKFKNNLRDTSTKRVKTIIKKLKAYRPVLHFSDIDSSFLVEYEAYLKGLGNSADHLLLGDDLLFTKIGSFDSGAERAPKRTKLDIILEDHREVLIEVQNGNLSYKDAIELLNDLGISVSEGTIGRALKRLEQLQ